MGFLDDLKVDVNKNMSKPKKKLNEKEMNEIYERKSRNLPEPKIDDGEER